MNTSQTLAQKLASIIEADTRPTDPSSINDDLKSIMERLDRLEHKTGRNELPVAHPSLDKFAVAEAIADQIFANGTEEKACTFEPNAKPCDHCSLCNSRGF